MLRTIIRLAGRRIAPGGSDARLSVLMYHRVLSRPDPLLPGQMHAALFDTHMRALRTHFNCLPLGEAVARLREGTLPPRAACVTFDDGYRDNVEVALPILHRHGVPAIFFIATGFLDGGRMFNDTVIEAIRGATVPRLDLSDLDVGSLPLSSLEQRRAAISACLKAAKYRRFDVRHSFVAELARRSSAQLPNDLMMDSSQVNILAAAGMEIGAHTVHHPILLNIDEDNARHEIVDSKRQLEILTGRPVTLFAYPNGIPGIDYGATHVAMVREAGFRAAVSTAVGVSRPGTDLHQLPRFTPWDRTAARFVLRLLRNCAISQPKFV
ncbi:MAG: polysaccharide deacetylase family protein [Burkholderiales bacterium]|nr:polysaccharide deacetylase family protein [Burkholderiales bacterium]